MTLPKTHCHLLLCGALLLGAWLARPCLADEPAPVPAAIAPEVVAPWLAPVELRLPAAALRGIPAGLNPYAPEQIRVEVRLEGPVAAPVARPPSLPAFWLEPQRLSADPKPAGSDEFSPAGPGEWRARWLPAVPGEYRPRWRVWSRGRISETPGEPVVISAAQAATAGALVTVADGAFVTRGGAPFIPIGLNLAWPDATGLAGYTAWLDRVAAAGGNAVRLWLVPYFQGTALEGATGQAGYTGAGHYNQAAAARVDAILAHAAQRGLRVMLTLNSFGPLADDWPNHPWHQANGGWLQYPGEVFLEARAVTAARAQVRYAVARWGASPALWAWELWNEVDGVPGYSPEVALAWHQEVARELRRLDVHGHPISTSYQQTMPMEPGAAYGLPEVDFAQLHLYRSDLIPTVARRLADLRDWHKPMLLGEFSLLPWGEGLEHDPAGLHLHDGLWAGFMAGGAGGGFGWWWDTWVMPRHLEWQLTGLARFTAGEDPRGSRTLPASLTDLPTGSFALARQTANGRFLAWLGTPRTAQLRDLDNRAVLAGYGTADPDTANTGTLTLAGDFSGDWDLTFYDPYDGLPLAAQRLTGNAEGLAVPLPAWRLDLAIKGQRATPETAPPTLAPPATLPLRTRLHERLPAADP